MNSSEFREFGKAAVDFIADYMDTIRERSVLPNVEPGYLATLVPQEMPLDGEDWREIMKDMDRVIMPGITHWQSPQFHAFYPVSPSFPSIVGELLASGLGVLGFSWLTSPACTELEVLVMNWLGKAMALPKCFLNSSEGPGGGVVQGTASEAILCAVLAAKRRAISHHVESENQINSANHLQTENLKECAGHFQTENQINSASRVQAENRIKPRLITYTSEQANSSVEKACNIADVRLRMLEADDGGALRGDTLLRAINEDLEAGNIPCCLVATLGTTGTCAMDVLTELGPLCARYSIWLHVDAAYAGAALLLPEYQYLAEGLEYADSFDFNPHKWLLTNHDCSAMWVKDGQHLMNAFYVDRIYLQHTEAPNMNPEAPDYTHWQISLSRRFRALKLWLNFRTYGLKGLQDHLRTQISLAENFAQRVLTQDGLELIVPARMGLVCFRIKGDNKLTNELHRRLTNRKHVFLIKATIQAKIFIRFVVASRLTEEKDVDFSWREILDQTNEVLRSKCSKTRVLDEENGMELETVNESLNVQDKVNDNAYDKVKARGCH